MSEDLYKNKYRIPSARLEGWDYGSHGLYYVTICTANRTKYFGEIEADEYGVAVLKATQIGLVAQENWLKIPEYHPYVELDAFVVMPNHLHGILFINQPDKTTWSPINLGLNQKTWHQYYEGTSRRLNNIVFYVI